MATNLKNKIKNPIVMSMIIVLVSISIAIGIGQSKAVSHWAEKQYFGSTTFIETFADLTSYLKQTVVEEETLYYSRYEVLDNMTYYIRANNGTKEFTNSEDVIELDNLENNSRFYIRVKFKDAYDYAIQSSNNDGGFTNRCFREKFNSIIDQGHQRFNIEELGYNDLEVYYFIKDSDIKKADFVYDNLNRYRILMCIKIAIILQLILTLSFMGYVLLAAYKGRLKGKAWCVLQSIHIETKIVALILICIGIREVYWQLKWSQVIVKFSEGSSNTKLSIGSLYVVGSILLTIILVWYLVDLIYIWQNGKWQKIKETSFIMGHKKSIGETLGLIYSVIGINIEKPSYIKIAIFNIIHIVALIVMVQITWGNMKDGMICAALYTGIGCIGAIVMVWDLNNMLRRIKKFSDKQSLARNYIKMCLGVLLYGGALMLLAIAGYILGTCIALTIGIAVAAFNVYYVRRYKELYGYVVEINKQNKPTKPPTSFLSPIIDELENINESFQNAVSQEVISQRMKTELISNVSHDLKTPLTSIINYVDLLKNEELTKEVRQEYVCILDQKSQRLKILIEDLFEASKAASGNMELVTEKIDLVALLKQTLGELEEKISASTLQFKMNMPEEKVMCELDGRRTYRIFENLIGNILKYSAPHSRVYIDCIVDEEVSIIFKNMSAYEMNFSAEEITDRFKRGDESRHTEGSGLGLAIAKNLTELQGGNLEVVIDGDLFKVIVKFKKEEE